MEDMSVLTAFVEAEQADPVPRKVVSAERTIYGSRKFRHPRAPAFGSLVLCDFGEARVGSTFSYEETQPAVYKSPEVLLQLQWNNMVDIWNVACMAWDMLQGQHLFDGHDEVGYHNNRVHIGEMVGLLGHPPVDLQHRSANSWRVFDDGGNKTILYKLSLAKAQLWKLTIGIGQWRGNPPLSLDSLEDRVTRPSQSKSEFLAFLRSMMTWRPEERKTARQLLADPWLMN
ncbi:hypothetical protein LTR09_000855 [Extremus antarcticus]|uniref:non-specific serine/threonine protein kinase n=1 Tax=Extremus antarcticus TaxID=702011 RepID=A0AAJ0GHT1_9PEZI|nr:hypothetical protein LTR09_000855 [Extremus antarcticus]